VTHALQLHDMAGPWLESPARHPNCRLSTVLLAAIAVAVAVAVAVVVAVAVDRTSPVHALVCNPLPCQHSTQDA